MIALLVSIRKYWIFTTLFILTVITVLSVWPLKSLPPVPGTDKAHHFIAYAALMIPTALRKPNYWLIISLFFIAWSGAIELIQPYVNRYGEFKDLTANVAGLGCGFLAVKIIEWFLPINSNPQ
ncbi:MAG TPA: VanZ family protein [Coleofasciculaceae cyanobacterium]|jgi:hypothetical protein